MQLSYPSIHVVTMTIACSTNTLGQQLTVHIRMQCRKSGPRVLLVFVCFLNNGGCVYAAPYFRNHELLLPYERNFFHMY